MITKLGEKFSYLFLKFMPDAFVFAIILTLLTCITAFIWMDVSPLEIIIAWYDGFFDLLEFGMQIVLIVVTGFCIALSPTINNAIHKLTVFIKTPKQVYFFVLIVGALLNLVSFGWVVITCVLARELALRVKGVNYPFLIACVYFSGGSWVVGLSSSIPLLLNTEGNYLITKEILSTTIPTSFTLGSNLNISMLILFIIIAPILFLLIMPKHKDIKELRNLMSSNNQGTHDDSIKEEAASFKLPFKAISDILNNSILLQYTMVVMGLVYIVYHFYNKGFNLNFNIMIFIFIIIGLLLHKTPMRYVVAMKRSSGNISGILFQYPFYAGIMGIMIYTGLGNKLADFFATVATINNYPFYAFLTGGLVNFAIPSAGGEFAVVGPSIIAAVKEIGTGLPQEEITAMISRASLSVAYGESLSNLLQPFFLLLVLPIMGEGVKLQARDVMGYLVLPFLLMFTIELCLVLWMPI